MTDQGSAYPPPPYQSAPADPGASARHPMVVRHLLGAAFALVATPVGLFVLDYGAGEYLRDRAVRLEDATVSGYSLLMLLGAGILGLVAASARVSGLGPVLAGLLWAAVPLLWFMVDVSSFYSAMRDLPGTHYWFSDPPMLFAPTAALLVGAGLAGRWRGALRETGTRTPDAASGWQ